MIRPIDPEDEGFKELIYQFAGEGLHAVFDWIMHGSTKQRNLRFHLVALCLFPQFFPCKHPSASWCARQHGVSRQWASRLHQQFTRKFGNKLQFRGQRFRNRWRKRERL